MSGSTEHRRAPRKSVVRVQKVGTWGNIVYHHVLECGHTEKRARNEANKKLACIWCLRAEEKTKEMAELPVAPSTKYLPDEDSVAMEHYLMTARAEIASKIGVNPDAVDIVCRDVAGNLEIKYATVFLTAHDVRKIAGQ